MCDDTDLDRLAMRVLCHNYVFYRDVSIGRLSCSEDAKLSKKVKLKYYARKLGKESIVLFT